MIKNIFNKLKSFLKIGGAKMRANDKQNNNKENQINVSNKKVIKNAILSFVLMAFDYIDYNYLDKIINNVFKRLKIRNRGDEFSVKSINLFYKTFSSGKAHMDIEPYIFVIYKIGEKPINNNNYAVQYAFIIGELYSIEKIENLIGPGHYIFNDKEGMFKRDIQITNNTIYKFKKDKVKIYKIIAKNVKQYAIKQWTKNEKNNIIKENKENNDDKIKAITQKIVRQIKNNQE